MDDDEIDADTYEELTAKVVQCREDLQKFLAMRLKKIRAGSIPGPIFARFRSRGDCYRWLRWVGHEVHHGIVR